MATILSLTIQACIIYTFSRYCFPNMRNHAKFRKKFELIAVQGHPRSSILVPVESACATH